ncbi:MAG: TolC family protein [Dysgonamonadaceae bacterium]|jgi:outer membrane protein|nr:TolC family protein [Dysgonamonadaceae bacterium]
MKQILLCILLLLLVIKISAQTEKSLVFSLEDCLNYAYEHNYSLQSMRLSEDAAADTYEQSKKERLPSLSASVSENLTNSSSSSASFSGSYGLSTSMTLYQGGNIDRTIEQSKLKKEMSAHQTSQYENSLIIQILQAFLTAIGNDELLRYQEVVVQASEEQWKQGKDQYRFGKILESEYLLLEAQYANDKNNVVSTQITRDNSLLALKKLLSMPAAENLQLLPPDTASVNALGLLPTMEEVVESTMLTFPDIKISNYNVDIATLNVNMSKANYLPTISLHGSIGTGHTDFTNYGTQLSNRLNEQIGITMSIPIYDNSRTKSKVTQSRIALQQAELDRRQTALNIEQNVTTEYYDVVSAFNKYQTTTIRQNAYSKTFEVYRAQFAAGSITTVDLLQQQNNYISALNDYIQSKYEFILKRKILDVYMGRMN